MKMNNKCLFFITLVSLLMLNSNSVAKSLKVVIILDKTEYEQGEKVAARLDFKGDIFAWGGYHWSIQKLENDSWTAIEKSGCKPFVSYEELYSDKQNGYPLCKFISCERPMWYKIDISHPYSSWEWNQKYVKEEKFVECWYEGLSSVKGDEKIDKVKCYIYDQVAPGKYKIQVEYTTAIGENNHFKKENLNIKQEESNSQNLKEDLDIPEDYDIRKFEGLSLNFIVEVLSD